MRRRLTTILSVLTFTACGAEFIPQGSPPEGWEGPETPSSPAPERSEPPTPEAPPVELGDPWCGPGPLDQRDLADSGFGFAMVEITPTSEGFALLMAFQQTAELWRLDQSGAPIGEPRVVGTVYDTTATRITTGANDDIGVLFSSEPKRMALQILDREGSVRSAVVLPGALGFGDVANEPMVLRREIFAIDAGYLIALSGYVALMADGECVGEECADFGTGSVHGTTAGVYGHDGEVVAEMRRLTDDTHFVRMAANDRRLAIVRAEDGLRLDLFDHALEPVASRDLGDGAGYAADLAVAASGAGFLIGLARNGGIQLYSVDDAGESRVASVTHSLPIDPHAGGQEAPFHLLSNGTGHVLLSSTTLKGDGPASHRADMDARILDDALFFVGEPLRLTEDLPLPEKGWVQFTGVDATRRDDTIAVIWGRMITDLNAAGFGPSPVELTIVRPTPCDEVSP